MAITMGLLSREKSKTRGRIILKKNRPASNTCCVQLPVDYSSIGSTKELK